MRRRERAHQAIEIYYSRPIKVVSVHHDLLSHDMSHSQACKRRASRSPTPKKKVSPRGIPLTRFLLLLCCFVGPAAPAPVPGSSSSAFLFAPFPGVGPSREIEFRDPPTPPGTDADPPPEPYGAEAPAGVDGCIECEEWPRYRAELSTETTEAGEAAAL